MHRGDWRRRREGPQLASLVDLHGTAARRHQVANWGRRTRGRGYDPSAPEPKTASTWGCDRLRTETEVSGAQGTTRPRCFSLWNALPAMPFPISCSRRCQEPDEGPRRRSPTRSSPWLGLVDRRSPPFHRRRAFQRQFSWSLDSLASTSGLKLRQGHIQRKLLVVAGQFG